MHRETPITRWRRYEERYALVGNTCNKCNKVYFPKKELCECGNKEFNDTKLSGKGKILTFTEISAAPEEFSNYTPYLAAIIELAEGPKITAQIVDCKIDDVKIGDNVTSTFRKLNKVNDSGIIHYGLKFEKI